MKKINITVGVFIPDTIEKLLLSAVCAYYEMSTDELFSNRLNREFARKRAILYYLTKNKCDKTDTEIAGIYTVKRQVVSQSINRIEFQVDKELYLQNTCDLQAIENIFADLQIKQKECLNQQISH